MYCFTDIELRLMPEPGFKVRSFSFHIQFIFLLRSWLAAKLRAMYNSFKIKASAVTRTQSTSSHNFCFQYTEGNGNLLQCSCLKNPRDGGAWWASIYGVTQNRTRLKWRSSSSSSRVSPERQKWLIPVNLWGVGVESVQFSCSVMSDSWPHGLQHTRPPCPSPTPRTCSNSYPSSQRCHPAISSFGVLSIPASNLSQHHQGLLQGLSSSNQVA